MSQLVVNQTIKGQTGLYRVIGSLTPTVYQACVEATHTLLVLLHLQRTSQPLTHLGLF